SIPACVTAASGAGAGARRGSGAGAGSVMRDAPAALARADPPRGLSLLCAKPRGLLRAAPHESLRQAAPCVLLPWARTHDVQPDADRGVGWRPRSHDDLSRRATNPRVLAD